jgi:hypothetical protein
MVRRWVDDYVLAVVSSTVTGRVLVVALFEENATWVIIGARAASLKEALSYRKAIDGRSS